MIMGKLFDKESQQSNLHCKEDDENEVGDQSHGGCMFYEKDQSDSCVVGYEREQSDKAMMSSDRCQKLETQACKQRLLVVANRLPVSATKRGEDGWQLEKSVGGLVSALLGVKGFEAKWIGWAGVDVPDEGGQVTLTKAFAEEGCIPLFFDKETVCQYYNGYCNKILWPLLHYLGLPQGNHLVSTRSYQCQFDEYKKANQMFADVVCKQFKDGDIVWCHDYHLMFLPQYLKEYNSNMKVGWFLHTPFPSSEVLRTLPSRSALLKSVLAADVVGFHTYDYARHFVNACTRILGLEGTLEGVVDHGKLIKVAVFPIGIDSNRFIQALKLSDVQNFITDLRAKFGERKLVLGVDRLDMVKGILQKMLAFEKFLEENPKWHHKVVLLQISVPTRTDVPEYQKFTRQVHELVGRINGKFGTLSHAPIHHLDQSLDFHTLCAMYAVTDVALVTSLRDGMNLVSYEFVACQASKKGVLILSEFAGSAQSLGAGAILVNPWNIEQVASSIAYALNMPSEEREKKHQLNYNHVTSHTAQEWAKLFVSELNGTVVEAPLRPGQVRARQSLPDIAVEQYVQSDNRLLILGFNATLTQSTECPSTRSDQIIDMKPKLVSDLHGLLRRIGSDPKTTIIVLSGSDRNVLDDNFGSYNMWLAAENGIFLRHTTGSWMTTMPECSSIEVVHSVKHVFEYFTKRTPHSYFEQRETSLLWNYKYADAEFGKLQARNFLLHLCTSSICSSDVYILEGERSVEVRARGVTKGATIGRILPEIFHSRRSMVPPINYVLCIGHFLEKDEDIYSFFESEPPVPVRTAPPNVRSAQVKSDKSGAHCEIGMCSAMEKVVTVVDLKKESYFSCAVGRERTSAWYVLRSSENVVSLLKKLAEVSLPSQ